MLPLSMAIDVAMGLRMSGGVASRWGQQGEGLEVAAVGERTVERCERHKARHSRLWGGRRRCGTSRAERDQVAVITMGGAIQRRGSCAEGSGRSRVGEEMHLAGAVKREDCRRRGGKRLAHHFALSCGPTCRVLTSKAIQGGTASTLRLTHFRVLRELRGRRIMPPRRRAEEGRAARGAASRVA